MSFEGFYLNQEQYWLIKWPSTDLMHHAEPITMTKTHVILQHKYSKVQLIMKSFVLKPK